MSIKNLFMNISEPVLVPVTKLVLSYHYRRELPLTEIKEKEKILIIAPHMDDETIGLGGTICRHADKGAAICCLFVTDGASSTGKLSGSALSTIRKNEVRQMQQILGIQQVDYLDFPDGQLLNQSGITKEFKDSIQQLQPDIIYCTTFVDGHQDHIVCAKKLAVALREVPSVQPVIRLYEINCPFPPDEINCVIDISKTFKKKQEAVAVFVSQVIAFDGFLELNRMKKKLVTEKIEAAEVFIQLTSDEFISRIEESEKKTFSPTSFKQANRTVTLLWAIFKNITLKKWLYEQ